VLSVGKGHIRVTFPTVPEDIGRGHWRIDIGCSDFAFKRQKEAIDRLNLDPSSQDLAEFARRKREPPPRTVEDEALRATRRRANPEQQVLTGTGLRDLLLRRFQADYGPAAAGLGPPAPRPEATTDTRPEATTDTQPSAPAAASFADAVEMKPTDVDAVASPSPHEGAPGILARNQLIQSWTRRYRAPEGREPVAVEGDPVVPLNPSQVRAIAMMLSERLSLVQGVSSKNNALC
jgi:hypothetical protein